MSKVIKKYDEKGNKIYQKNPNGFEYWQEYDENNNIIHYKTSNGEWWWKYDENNNLVYSKRSFGYENWYKCDKNNKRIKITEQEYKEIEFRKQEKEYLSREKCSRFEIMDI